MQNHFLITLAASLLVSLSLVGQTNSPNGHLTIKKVARNAVRIQYQDKTEKDTLPDWLYVKHDEVSKCDVKVEKDDKNHTVTIKDRKGNTLFHATRVRSRTVSRWLQQCPWTVKAPHAGQYTDIHPHADFQQRLRHSVE